MYEISRIYLRSVGPAGARYENVLLDFSKAGHPVTEYQDNLFASVSEVLRPSPASIIFLENGGGKSVLLKLVFSVLLPGVRNTVGSADGSTLADFVGAKDISHVVLEWTHTVTGRLLITGKTMAWKGQAVSAVADNFLEQWYCFFPTETLHLDNLPLVENGRYLTFQTFRSQMNAGFTEDSQLDLYWLRTHRDWTERLGKLGIDTELFRYQRHMNAGEGEAVRAFALETDDRFVDFLLEAVLPEKELMPLADLVAEHVDKLARRATTLLERDFVDGALALLEPLRRDAERAAVSQKRSEQAQAFISAFAGRIATRRDREKSSLVDLVEKVKAAENDFKAADTAVADLRRREDALRLQKASLELQEAERHADEAAGKALRADTEVKAWESTDKVLEHLKNSAEAERLRMLVQLHDVQARPVLEARTIAAKRLARALLGLAQEAAEAASGWDERAEDHEKQATSARKTQQEAIAAAATAEANAAQFSKMIAGVDGQLSEAVKGNFIDSVEELPIVLSAAQQKLEDSVKEVLSIQKRIDELIDNGPILDADLRTADSQAKDAEQRDRTARAAVEAAYQRRGLLESEERLAALLDTEDVRLEQDAPALVKLLTQAIADCTRDSVGLMVEETRDERDRLALAEGDLLPPPIEVEEACAALDAEGVQAWPGWEYAAGIPDPDRRREFIRIHPHLVAGILLNSKDDIDSARRILSGDRHQSAWAVTIAATEALEQPGPSAPALVLPFKPALYDPAEADQEHQRIETQHQERTANLAVLAKSRQRDIDLSRRVGDWLRDYPAGRVAELEEQRDKAAEQYAAALSAVTEAEQAKERNEALLTRARTKQLVATEEKIELEERARALEALAEQAAKIPGWRNEQKALVELARMNRDAAEAHGRRAQDKSNKATQAVLAADQQRRAEQDLHGERAALPGCGGVTVEDERPSEPVPVLRDLYETAAERYRTIGTVEDLRDRLAGAEKAATTTATAYEALSAKVRERAKELLGTPEGANATSRTSALRLASRVKTAADQEHQNALVLCGERRNEVQRQQEAWNDSNVGPIDELHDFLPTDVTICDQGIQETHDALAKAIPLAVDREKALLSRRREHSDAKEAAQSFETMADILREDLPETASVPYEGGYLAAKSEHAILITARKSARSMAAEGADLVKKSARALHTFSREERFAQLSAAVQREINGTEAERLAKSAPHWEERLRPRLRSLNDDLEQIERHRRTIVTLLKGEVGKALNILRSAQRVSRLPSHLGDWRNEEFLRFQYDRLSDEVLIERLGEVIDEAAAGKTSDNRKVQRTGLALVLRAVHAAVPRGFKVLVLKPDTTLRVECERVSRVKKVFSGGQQLTAAILLYCTMAALRANDRGRRLDHRAGLLFLDNPIGRANADYLLDLQRSVAHALGVQLIYTTGLFDDKALRQFPLIIRLRNDADLRSARKYLSLEARIKGQLDHLPPADGTGLITAARIYDHGRDPGEPSSQART
ncbi:hypothetical protein ACIBQ1_37230 [Nonomuraea sp. NPDC050153]|uniref:hypothetical protein n=1 Tax=Nonomuraea sp. NPDC050153 TaxID=3364359 RepID=UPI0037BB82A6